MTISSPSSSSSPSILTANTLMPFLLIGVLFVLLFPMPTWLMDLLLVLNISFSMLILLLMFYINKPMDLNSFPSLLLVMTLFRLSLNVASTKLILLQANAGKVIDAFGNFVIGGDYVVGTVVFLILVMIQFIVITRGATRIAEVAARFTLDAMPGKQMSIDADLNAGLIDEHEARRRRQQIAEEAEFYGAMDGASKFVRGDAIAGLVITGINIVGGLGIGMWKQGMTFTDALQHYTVLTIGDGLVSQIPALLISVAAGMLVTKTASQQQLGDLITRQLFRRPEPLYVASIILLALGVMPAFPFFPFAILAGITYLVGKQISIVITSKPGLDEELEKKMESLPTGATPPSIGSSTPLSIEGSSSVISQVTPLVLEIGFSLIGLVDKEQNGDLVDRIGAIRNQIREELGFLIPSVQIRDNIELSNNEYRLLLRGLEKCRGSVYPASMLAINPGTVTGTIEGVQVKDPAFGFDAIWIQPNRAESAEMMGYTVVDATSVITTHITKIIRENAAELLSRQDVNDMLDTLKKTHRAVVEELIPNLLSVGIVHRVLQHLLVERVPIHDLPVILEVLADYAHQTRDPAVLAEFCRQALRGHILSKVVHENGTLYALTLSQEIEEEIRNHLTQGSGGKVLLGLPPDRTLALTNLIQQEIEQARNEIGGEVVLLVSPLIRMHLSAMLRRKIEDLHVLSFAEIEDDLPLQVIKIIKDNLIMKEETLPS